MYTYSCVNYVSTNSLFDFQGSFVKLVLRLLNENPCHSDKTFQSIFFLNDLFTDFSCSNLQIVQQQLHGKRKGT